MKSKRWISSAQPLSPPKSLVAREQATANFPDVLAECVGDLARRMASDHEAGKAKQFEVILEELTTLRADNTSLRMKLGNDAQDAKQPATELESMNSLPSIAYTLQEAAQQERGVFGHPNTGRCSNGSATSISSKRSGGLKPIIRKGYTACFAQANSEEEICFNECDTLNEQQTKRATFIMGDPDGESSCATAATDVELEEKTYEVLNVWRRLRTVRRTRSRINSESRMFTGEISHCDAITVEPEVEMEVTSDDASLEEISHSRIARLLPCCQLHHVVMDPCCNRRLVWDTMAVILFFADTIYVPLQMLNTYENSFNGPMSWTIRLYWTLNMPISMFTGYLRKDGSTQTDLKATAARYARTWLLPDLLLVLLDWMEVFLATIINSNFILRVIRLVRLLRITRISGNLYSALKIRYNSERAVIMYDIGGIVICLVSLTHVIACLWYAIGNWDAHNRVSWIDDSGLREARIEYQYVASFHWALSQFAGGMDEFRPGNLEERIFTIVILLTGFMVLSMCVSGLTSSMTRLIMISSVQSRQLAKLRQYLSETCISRKLALRIQNNAEQSMLQRNRRTREQDVELLGSISESMLVELHFETRAPPLMAHSFFERYDQICPSGMRSVCHKAISLKSCSPGDLVFTVGETPATPQMLFLTGGTLRYMKPNFYDKDQVIPSGNIETHTSRTVFKGSWIAEANLWTRWEHVGTLSVVTFCDILAINAATFQEIVCRFQNDFLDECVDYAFNFVKFLNSLNPEVLTDLEMLVPTPRKSEGYRDSRVSRVSMRVSLAPTVGRMESISVNIRRSLRNLAKISSASLLRTSVDSTNSALMTRSRTFDSMCSAKLSRLNSSDAFADPLDIVGEEENDYGIEEYRRTVSFGTGV